MNYIEKTLFQVLKENAERFPDKEFVIYADRNLRFTYAGFLERVDHLARGLYSIGVRRGDHVGVWATNVPDWLTLLFASARIGAILVTVNTNYKTHEAEYLIKDADIHTLCLIDGYRDCDYVEMTYELVPELKEAARGALISERFPQLRNVVFMGPEKKSGMYNIPELLLLGSYQEIDLDAITASLDPNDVVNMQYTSGTTGFPKGVQLTHRNILNNGFNIGECQKFTEKTILCLPVPLFHCFGLVLGIMALYTHAGTVVVIENFDPLLVLASVEKERCTALYGVPTMFIAELNHPMFSLFDLSSLRTGIMAGSLCPVEVMQQVIDKMNMKDITIAYGLTEASPVMTQTRTSDSLEVKVHTVGRELPGIEVSVRNPETGEGCPVGVQGEMCCRGYNVMKGYYKRPQETAECIDADGWLHSGDLGIKDENGNYRITGRIKDMIIRGGENIYPREIEEFIYQMPEVRDVQVAGIPSKKYGEEVGAFIILNEGASLDEQDVKSFCKGKISRHKIPKYVFFVSEFPLTGSGKIQKFKLGGIGLKLLEEAGTEVI